MKRLNVKIIMRKDNAYKSSQKENFLFLFSTLILTTAVSFCLNQKFNFFFSSNDDITLHSLMSGSYTGSPESHLIYIMHPLGVVFSSLYTLTDTLDWYAIFASYGHYLCLFLCAYRIGSMQSKLSCKLKTFVIAFIAILCINLNYIYAYQYTIFAGILTFTGTLWLITTNISYMKDSFISVAFLTLGYWLRKEVFFMSLPILFILIMYRIVAEKHSDMTYLARAKKWSFALVLIFFIILFSSIENRIAYNSGSWKSFAAFNQARTELYDYVGLPDYEKNVELYNLFEISPSEYIALRQYDIQLLDKSVVNTDVFLALSHRQKELLKSWEQYYSVPRKIIRETFEYYFFSNITLYQYLFIIIGAISIILPIIKRKFYSCFMSLTVCAFVVCVSAYLLHKKRFLERVSYPLILLSLFALTYILVTSCLNGFTASKRNSRKILHIICMALLLMSFVFQYSYVIKVQQGCLTNSNNWLELNNYMKNNPNCIYLLDTGLYATSAEKMFSGLDVESSNSYKLSCWIAKSELQRKRTFLVFDSNYIDYNNPSLLYILPDGIENAWIKDIHNYHEMELADQFITSSDYKYNIYSAR